MRLLLIVIGVIAGSILGVLVDWLLKGLSNVKPTPRNITAVIVACAVLAFFAAWSELLTKDPPPTQVPPQKTQTTSPALSTQIIPPTNTSNIELQKVQQYEVRGNEGTEMVFSPDGNTLFVNDGDVVKAWEVETGIKIREYKSPQAYSDNYIEKISVSADGSKLVGATGDGTFAIWDIQTSNLLANIPSDETSITTAHRAYDVDISQNGKTIVGSTVYDFGVWNTSTGKKNLDLDMSEWVMAIKFLPDSNDTFIAGLYYGTIVLMDTNGKKLKFYEGATSVNDTNSLAVSNKGDMIAAPVPINQTSIRVWDTDSTVAVYTLECNDNTSIQSVVFSPNDLLFVGSSFGNMWIWDAKNGGSLYAEKIDVSVLDIAVRPKRNQIVTISENHITLWNVINLDIR